MSHTDKDPGHVIGGLKAAISNPNTSTEAKEHAAERLKELGDPGYSTPPHEPPHEELGSHQIAGYKATISNPNTSEKAKQHAREVLEAEGEQVEETHPEGSHPASAHDQHTKRVLAGYKAALHNPHVSQEAKERAKEMLREHGEEF
ncbi:hypothetical protein BDM02DRAFT_3108461 [Thelephora ganbajun]|uniref:Uncharacterized protein n=1 Tax=Thelephora ganbajun TaxID=370292 RepID=A0ACB6ZTH6_THEGA|nr:hypothetical protein BDM02DRAFT_3108461 [Thelephora ganbajun]